MNTYIHSVFIILQRNLTFFVCLLVFSPTSDKEILLYHDNKIVIGMELPEERLKSHEWIFMRMTLAQINVKGVTRKGLVVYHVSISDMDKWRGKMKFFHSTSSKCKFFPDVFPFCESFLFYFITFQGEALFVSTQKIPTSVMCRSKFY